MSKKVQHQKYGSLGKQNGSAMKLLLVLIVLVFIGSRFTSPPPEITSEQQRKIDQTAIASKINTKTKEEMSANANKAPSKPIVTPLDKNTKVVVSKEAIKKAAIVKIFVESDFYWDDQTKPHKDIIIAGVNKIHKENSRCSEIDPSSAYISSSKGTKNDPVFYVTCGKGGGIFNAFFSKSEVDNGKKLTANSHIDRALAINICEKYVKQNTTHPSTVDYSKFLDMKVNNFPNGNTRVETTFSAKNSFNLERKHKVECLFNASGLVEGIITEIGS